MIAELSKPLRELLSTKRAWLWGPEQNHSFDALKAELTKPMVLALYNPEAKVSADASSFGLGAVLLQKDKDGEWRPVAYASRALSETERCYAQIEKEALAITWSCEKFSDYILSRHFEIETDHKPLVPLMRSKHLNDLPPRVLRFRLRMAKFDYEIRHVPGKYLYTVDTLSRDTIPELESDPLEEEGESYDVVGAVTQFCIPATPQRLQEYCRAQEEDPDCVQVKEYCQDGWPEKKLVPLQLMPFWKARSNLTICESLLLYDSRIVVLPKLQRETLQKIHAGHLGIEKSKKRVKPSVWWLGVGLRIEQFVQKCPVCVKESQATREPLIPTDFPKFPWQVVGTDLFEY